jgi:hypothetical protein
LRLWTAPLPGNDHRPVVSQFLLAVVAHCPCRAGGVARWRVEPLAVVLVLVVAIAGKDSIDKPVAVGASACQGLETALDPASVPSRNRLDASAIRSYDSVYAEPPCATVDHQRV